MKAQRRGGIPSESGHKSSHFRSDTIERVVTRKGVRTPTVCGFRSARIVVKGTTTSTVSLPEIVAIAQESLKPPPVSSHLRM